MENLTENMSDMLRKCKMMEDYVSLHLRRDSVMQRLQDLKSTVANTERTLDKSNKILDGEHSKALEKYKNLMTRMRNQQVIILNLISAIKERKKEVLVEITSVKKPSQLRHMTPLATKIFKNQQSHYENSPFLSSNFRPIALNFFDFDAKITEQMFNEIPKYMRGRETLDELLNFLDNILVPCFIEKYQLISKKRDAVKKPNDLQMWNMYKDQISLFPDHKFITQGDLTKKLNKLIDKKIQAKITMLRHLNIIAEQRKSSIIYYIWSKIE